jgi:tRNA A-37 threonylcarbamoyl transferase component Bud32
VDPIASGRDADVFALDETTVLRRYRTPRKRCDPEALTMQWVHALGFPVPRVHSAEGPDMVLDRVHGPTMRESVVAGTTTTEDGGRVLADLHGRACVRCHLRTDAAQTRSGTSASIRTTSSCRRPGRW